MAFYDDMRDDVAQPLIQEFGVSGTLNQETRAYDPTTGENVASASDTETTIRFLMLPIERPKLRNLFREEMINKASWQFIVSAKELNDAGVQLTNNDKIIYGGSYYQVIDILRVAPGGTPVIYKVLVEGAVPSATSVVGTSYYVDGVAGSDANTGLSSGQALKTIGAIPSLARGDVINVKRNSIFREYIDINQHDVTIQAYGTGANPTFNGSDVFTGWSKTGGYTNVYEVAVTATDSIDSSTFIRAFENYDTALTRQTSIANVDATAGSYYATGTYPNYTVYIHATGSGNPTSNGYTYEVTTRPYGVHADIAVNGITAIGIDCLKSAHIDGSLVLRGTGNTMTDCKAFHGSKHNMFIGSGTVTRCEVKYAEYDVSAALLVAFLNEPSGESITITDSLIEQDPNNITLGSGFLSHVGGSATTTYSSLTINNTKVKFCSGAFNYSNNDIATINDCDVQDCNEFVHPDTVPTTVNGGSLIDTYTTAPSILSNTSNITFQAGNGYDLTIQGGFYVAVRGSNVALFYATGAAKIKMDDVRTSKSMRNAYTRMIFGTSMDIDVQNTYFNGCDMMYEIDTPTSWISEDNIVDLAGVDNNIDNVAYSTLAAYQSAYPTRDVNTVVGTLP